MQHRAFASASPRRQINAIRSIADAPIGSAHLACACGGAPFNASVRSHMQVRKYTQRWMKGSLEAFSSVLSSFKPEQNPQYGERIMKMIRGEPIKPATLAKMTRDEQFAATMFRRFTEVYNCIERLKDCEAYVGSSLSNEVELPDMPICSLSLKHI